MSAPAIYRIAFCAEAAAAPATLRSSALGDALRGMPGVGAVEDVHTEDGGRRVTAAFRIEVRLGMADAARDGSRLAKEALKVAGLGDSQLTELAVTLRQDAPGG